MKASSKMQSIIALIAKKHGLDLEARESHLRLEMPGFDRLVIEKIGENLVSVAHYYEQNGDLIAEPDVVFFTGHRSWEPIEITQSLGGTRRVARLDDQACAITHLNTRAQKDLGLFTEQWALNIKAQGWLEDAQRT
jgi:hypothetical protein